LRRFSTGMVNLTAWGDTQTTSLSGCSGTDCHGQRSFFYSGESAECIVRACHQSGGILTRQDLSEYKPVWREPITFDYRGYRICSMPPPSSGGVALAEIMNILCGFPLSYLGPGSVESLHLLASAFELTFADRAAWLGDPDFHHYPLRV
jgi:gamma-glutamyltranspeptidase/glutathione hydrolase